MIALGIDAATTTGWGLVMHVRGREALVGHGRFRPDPASVRAFATKVFGGMRPDVVAIEDPFMGKNVGTLKKLARIAGWFEMEFAAAGVPVTYVLASTWQRCMLTGLITGRSGREARKAGSLLWARAVLGRALPSEDEADAAALAAFAARQGALGRISALAQRH